MATTQTAFRPKFESHWYYPNGTPCHEVLKSPKPVITYEYPDGRPCLQVASKNGELRNPRSTDVKTHGLRRLELVGDPILKKTTVKEARLLGLLPSVTNILSVIEKPHLRSYLMRMAAVAAVTTPHLTDQTEDEWWEKVEEAADEHRNNASKLGSDVHYLLDEIHQWLTWNAPDKKKLEANFSGNPLWCYAKNWIGFLLEQEFRIIGVEQVVASPLGYAGKVDLILKLNGKNVIIDFKTKEIKDAKPPRYDDNPKQLSAYRAAYDTRFVCANVFINTHAPLKGDFYQVYYEHDELDEHFEGFLSYFDSWCVNHKYNPLKNENVIKQLESIAA